MILPNGRYIIRPVIGNNRSILWLISSESKLLQTDCPPAIATRILRKMNNGIRERDLPAECFVEVINRHFPPNGTILLRQNVTGRYAVVDRELKWRGGQQKVLEEDQMISFVSLDQIEKDAEFKLIAPNGNKADGVAIRSKGKNRYLSVSDMNDEDRYLRPNCDISRAHRFVFESRYGFIII